MYQKVNVIWSLISAALESIDSFTQKKQEKNTFALFFIINT